MPVSKAWQRNAEVKEGIPTQKGRAVMVKRICLFFLICMKRDLWLVAILCSVSVALHGQDFKLLGRDFQVHAFVTQGIVRTNQNNWLTMPTSVGSGSAQFTDFGRMP
jgi:hypothetical protein